MTLVTLKNNSHYLYEKTKLKVKLSFIIACVSAALDISVNIYSTSIGEVFVMQLQEDDIYNNRLKRPLMAASFKFFTECLPLIFFQICLVISSRSKSEIKNYSVAAAYISSSSNSTATHFSKPNHVSVKSFESTMLNNKLKSARLTKNRDRINSFMNN